MPSPKLTGKQVTELRKRYIEGETSAVLCKQYGISNATIHRMLTGASYIYSTSRDGLQARVDKMLDVKLDFTACLTIRSMYRHGATVRSLADNHKVSQKTIRRVLAGQTRYTKTLTDIRRNNRASI